MLKEQILLQLLVSHFIEEYQGRLTLASIHKLVSLPQSTELQLFIGLLALSDTEFREKEEELVKEATQRGVTSSREVKEKIDSVRDLADAELDNINSFYQKYKTKLFTPFLTKLNPISTSIVE